MSALTRQSITQVATEFMKRSDPSITTLEALCSEIFPGIVSRTFVDNLILDQFTHANAPTVLNHFSANIARVYEAAKIMMQSHDSFDYDFLSSVSLFGSPWGSRVHSPEQWAINFARTANENDECATSDEITQEIRNRAVATAKDLIEAGITKQHIAEHLMEFTYGRYLLANHLIATLGLSIPPIAPTKEMVEQETEVSEPLML